MKTLAALIVLAFSTTALAAEGSAEAGKTVFKKCTACHNIEQAVNKVGPHLDGIVGRQAAALADYTNYSDAMKEQGANGLIWDEATLATYLAGPKKMIPKTRMAFSGLKSEQDIADVIAYLKSVKAQ
ncbi:MULTISPECIES: c-type cytochrome [Shinella]|uniref:Cytochrome c family protein n=1 Tax=Shinella sedimenti TaxID=2919913 RepID=A0ABT0CQP1_9HYPH|nr:MULTISPECIES: cytochrome c family protein [Shinella]MCJ8150935.1 cytochrome c family protein [Shinella sedimenti]